MKLSKTMTINVSADRVWQVVANEFARVGEWASAVQHSSINHDVGIPNGAEVGGRVCQVPGFGELRETFTHYDAPRKTYTFKVSGMPFFVTSAQNTWVVEPVNAKTSRVSFEAEMKTLPVIGWLMHVPMRMQLGNILSQTLDELKYYVETGLIHERKQRILAKSSRRVAA